MNQSKFYLTGLLSVLLAACGQQSDAPMGDKSESVSKQEAAQSSCVVTPPSEPMMCTMDWNPVCGCDGITYPNACGARAAGVPESTPGECENGDGGRKPSIPE